MKELPIIQSLWIGKKLSSMEQLSITSFLRNGHSFHLYVYDEVAGIPPKTIIKDANQIVPANKIFKYKNNNSYAGFSNLFRYQLLFEKGNFWVDTDIIALKPFNFPSDYVFGSESLFLQSGFKREILKWWVNLKTSVPKLSHFPPYYLVSPKNKLQLVKIGNGIIKCPPSSHLGKYCYTKAASRDPNTLRWGDTGPTLFSKAIIKLNLQEWVMPSEFFYPLNWWDWKWVIEDGKTEQIKIICRESYAIHLWNEMWRRKKIDKDATFSPNCFYERLKQQYNV
ncbi:hypothetical protein THII_1354 [Thioploca ingrica]|uniref:Alpha 1,4-glycosyltransferase domain-containing protein n=1 Tax=Thioploca ingrica TaxID=40754 RepID=A0A090BUT2_9GAMM|nr:hypothetical protein THII_1354 [Thioploca ingrica]